MPTCLLVNPIVNNNILAQDLVNRGVECSAFIEMENIKKMPLSLQNKERDFQEDLFTAFYFKKEDLPSPRKTPFDAVIAGVELGVETAESICKNYGLPGNNPKTTHLRRNKARMHQKLMEAGLPHIRTCTIKRGDNIDIVKSIIPVGPYILKPLNAAGGEGLSYCSSIENLQKAIITAPWGSFNCAWDYNNQFLVQEYVPGTEYVVDLVATRGNMFVTAISRDIARMSNSINGKTFLLYLYARFQKNTLAEARM